ncbi:MAG: PilZ domain-containing protein [Deltaproteobacteria bacterium]|jgi:hypothetical protein|nr:PilZ domain-containing protein [Deltaproteobacteria bacterium]
MPRASQEYNLYVLKPELIMEWHPTRNNDLRPRDVTPGSGKKVWWLCREGHEWQAAIYSRSRGSGCPLCYNGNQSNEEQFVASDIALVVEWHPTKNGKIRLRDLGSDFRESVWWICQKGHEWQATIKNRLKGAGCPHCDDTVGQKLSSLNESRLSPDSAGREAESNSQKNDVKIGPEIIDMQSGTDFRKDKRFEFQDTVILENQDSGQWIYARAVNISGVGLFIESETSFKPGTKLTVQFNHSPFKSMHNTFPTIVRWCKELPYDSTASYFGIGVEFI